MKKRYGHHENHVVHEDFGDEVVAIHLKNGIYYSLGGSGRFIWNLFKINPDESTIHKSVYQSFTGHEPDMKASVSAFIEELLKEDLIRVMEKTPENPVSNQVSGPDEVNITAPPAEKKPFTAPVLSIYSDQKELLLLDPIHEVDDLGWPEKKDKAQNKS